MAELKPIGNRLILKSLETTEKSSGGIYIPDNAQEKKNIAEVVAVGDAVKSNIKLGDNVIYSKFAPTEIEIENKKLMIIEEKEILAIIK